MSVCIALVRGINVGKGNRIAMAELKDLVGRLGYTDVRTLLNSGNVVFQSKRRNVARISSAIQAAIAEECGFSAAVMVITAETLNRIIEENPLLRLVNDPARHLVAFVADAQHLESLRPMLKQTWTPDALAITKLAAYLWCSSGLIDSRVSQTFTRKAGATITTRNWTTVLKLQAAAREAT